MDEIIKKVEDFINRIHTFDLVLIGADKVEFVFGDYPKQRHSDLAMELAKAMTNYETSGPDAKSETAINCLRYINETYTHGVLDNQEGLRKQIKDCAEKKTTIEQQLYQAQQRITDLENLVRLHGGNPDRSNETLTGGTSEGGDSHEH